MKLKFKKISKRIPKIDAYKMHVKNDLEMLSDLALNKLVSGESVEVIDEAGSKYEPLFTVKFKKA